MRKTCPHCRHALARHEDIIPGLGDPTYRIYKCEVEGCDCWRRTWDEGPDSYWDCGPGGQTDPREYPETRPLRTDLPIHD